MNFIKGVVISKCNFPNSNPEHYANLLLDYWVLDAGRNHITELSRADDVYSVKNFQISIQHFTMDEASATFPIKIKKRKGFESARNKIKGLL